MPCSELDSIALADLAGDPDLVVLCPTARLAAGLRRTHSQAQVARGKTVWAALNGATLAQWLDHLVSSALLRGEIPPEAMPGVFLTRPQERVLWQQAIAADAALAGGALFDREGLALTAMDAEALRLAWRIEVPEAMQGEESRAFARWRGHVADVCKARGWITAAAAMAWRIDCVARGIGGLPARVGIAGFIAPDPVLARLLAVLEARGVVLFRVDMASTAAGGMVLACDDAEAECRAAAAWARISLDANPRARLRVAVADWPARRRMLESALEDALHPDAVGAGWAAQERRYAAAGGSALSDVPLVAVALGLLQLRAQPRRVALADFGALLCAPGWSADLAEADGRARLDAMLREELPPETSLEHLRRAVRRVAEGCRVPRLVAALEALADASRTAPNRQLPGAWGQHFDTLLAALDWPGERPALPAEDAIRLRLTEVLAGLAMLDAVVGRVDAGAAMRLLRQACREMSFAAPRISAPAVELCALDEVLAGSVDGLWVMGLNEGAWPPPPRPNPLLPAAMQRAAGVAEARADSQAGIAREMQSAWCAIAPEVVLSWIQRDGERAMRPSPLLDGLPPAASMPPLDAAPMIERLEEVDDFRAPPLDAAERARIRGGTALLQAQALCPAWGFFQYRLGAKALPTPVFGLDARVRGGLLHGALEAFWRGRDLAYLLGMSMLERDSAIDVAVDVALASHDREAVEPLPPRLAALERERLAALLEIWLELESRRPDFRVLACEERHALEIAGLPMRLVVDRVDQLADGRLVVIDYKSGRVTSADTWADERIGEPQLPIYAALVFPDRDLAAVALARVVADQAAFLGVAADADVLPGVKPLAAQSRRYASAEFADWAALRSLWARRIEALAREFCDGHAEVLVADEDALVWCEVRPLLRLAERRAQYEAS